MATSRTYRKRRFYFLSAAHAAAGLEIQVSNGSLAGSCVVRVDALANVIAVDVPDIGEVMTPIYGFYSETTAATGGIVSGYGFGEVANSFLSSMVGRVENTISPVATRDVISEAASFIAGDSLLFDSGGLRLRADWESDETSGLLTGTARFELFLPPTAAPAAPRSASGSVGEGLHEHPPH